MRWTSTLEKITRGAAMRDNKLALGRKWLTNGLQEAFANSEQAAKLLANKANWRYGRLTSSQRRARLS